MVEVRANPSKQVRRRPKQARSIKKYEAILRAATQVLKEVGFKNATTSEIAYCADVPIATLYQYFEDKYDIVQQLLEFEFANHMASVEVEAQLALGRPLPELVASLARLAVRFVRKHQELLNVVATEIPGFFSSPQIATGKAQVIAVARSLGVALDRNMDPDRIEIMGHILVNAVLGYFFAIVSSPVIEVDDDDIVLELTALITSYVDNVQQRAVDRSIG